MAKALVIYRLRDGDISGVVVLSQNSDTDLYPEDPATQGKIEIPMDHPILGNQEAWSVENHQLTKEKK